MSNRNWGESVERLAVIIAGVVCDAEKHLARGRNVIYAMPCYRSLSGESEEIPLNWSKWIRQTHRWLSIAFTVAVIVNIVAVSVGRYSARVGLLAVVPLAFQFFTGLYLCVLPYGTKWRSVRSTD